MVRNNRRRCKRQGVSARERMSALRLTRKGFLNAIHLKRHLSVAVAWRCICSTSLALRRIQTEANMAPIAKGQKHVLLHLDQSRASGSGSDAIAFCSNKLTQPVRLTPIGRLASTAARTRGSSLTWLPASGSISDMVCYCFAGKVCPYCPQSATPDA